MDDLEVLLGLLALFLFVAVPVMSIVALVKTGSLRADLERLQKRLAVAERALAERGPALPQSSEVPEVLAPEGALSEDRSTDSGEALVVPPPLPSSEVPPEILPEIPSAIPPAIPGEALAAPMDAVASSVVKPPVLPAPGRDSTQTERTMAERWLVWLGGLALALGGAFLVKYSADQGLLGPLVRVVMGAVAGTGAVVLGHWLSLRQGLPSEEGGFAAREQVPAALVAGGAAMVFASLYAAYALYDLMPHLVAFAALVGTAFATVLLSLRHGPFVALLGLIGGFAVPLLVRSGNANAFGLFSYLTLLTTGALLLLRWRGWWWLAWAVLSGSAGWVMLWLIGPWSAGDGVPLTLFIVVQAGLFTAFRAGLTKVPALAGRAEGPQVRQVVWVAGAVLAALALLVAGQDGFSETAMLLPLVLGAGALALGWRDRAFDRMPWMMAALGVLTMAAWTGGTYTLEDAIDLPYWPMPGEAGRFARTGLLLAALFGGVGFVAAWRAIGTDRPAGRWAAVSAAAPVGLLAVCYWRLLPVSTPWQWAVAALVLAAVFCVAAERMARRCLTGETGPEAGAGPESGAAQGLAAYAVGTLAAIALAATFVLEEAWLSVALAVMVTGVGWVETRLRALSLPVPELRKVTIVLAGVVLVRLAANPYVLEYPIAEDGVFSWLLYGYGVPLIAFGVAARLFRKGADDLLVTVLEAGAVAFAVLLAGFGIRHLMTGGLTTDSYSLGEQSVHTAVWLAGAAILFLLYRRNGRLVPLWGGRFLLALGVGQAVLFQALLWNPLLTGEPVGETLVLNGLLLAFAVPAALFALHVRLAPAEPDWQARACAVLALAFGFLWATLEVRHAFSGTDISALPVDQAELWAYSALWLTGGVGVLFGGLRLGNPWIRRAGLGIVLLVVAKVFLIDMSQSSGIWRALSFLGLGFGLVGIGWLYRRFVEPVRSADG